MREVDVNTLIQRVKCGGLAVAQEDLLAVATFDHKVNERLVYGSGESCESQQFGNEDVPSGSPAWVRHRVSALPAAGTSDLSVTKLAFHIHRH